MVGTLEEEEIGDTVLPKAALVREGVIALGLEGTKAHAKQKADQIVEPNVFSRSSSTKNVTLSAECKRTARPGVQLKLTKKVG